MWGKYSNLFLKMFIKYHFWGQTIYKTIYDYFFSNSIFRILLDKVELFFTIFSYPVKARMLVA